MALLNSCICCSLLMGSIICGVYSAIVYGIAVILTLYWIIKDKMKEEEVVDVRGTIPLPAFFLAAGYFVMATMAVVLIVGLYRKQEKVLLTWLFAVTLFFFPELGMVLFMSLYYWTLETPHGLTELTFYVCRAVMNLLCVLCVQSLYSSMRDSSSASHVLKRLEHFQLRKMSREKVLGSNSSPVQKGQLAPVAYSNPSFQVSQENLHGGGSYSSASQLQMTAPNYGAVPVGGWDPYTNLPLHDTRSEFNAAVFNPRSVALFTPTSSQMFNGGPTGSLPRHTPGTQSGPAPDEVSSLYPDDSMDGMTIYHHYPTTGPRTLLPQGYPYMYPYPPQVHPQFSTQSLDRRRYMRGDPYRRASSMDALNLSGLGPPSSPGSASGGYPPRHESRSSLGAGSDDLRRYRDVAL
ncbi:reduction in Cnn dots 6 [Oratosquilla oratoria]|uniref:reduction in Cnn dots 6 n=1 Tax=Oratosquilla oratoria TaxID=337810 RepID=UPI003F76B7D5